MTNFEWVQKHYGMTRYRWAELRRLERALHKWSEDECNGRIQWHEQDGEEEWCLKEAKRHAAACGLKVYYQGDPRGCQLYLYNQTDLNDRLERDEVLRRPGMGIGACYNSVGTAVC